MKDNKAIKIYRITPIGFYDFAIEFGVGTPRIFSPSKCSLHKKFSFLAYPHANNGFTYNSEKITWSKGVSLDSKFLYQVSTETTWEKLANQSLRIGMKNQAPTAEDKKHHVYSVSIYPFATPKKVALSESIGGGFGDRGGSLMLTIDKLPSNEYWEEHFIKADCKWAVNLVKLFSNEPDKLFDKIIKKYSR